MNNFKRTLKHARVQLHLLDGHVSPEIIRAFNVFLDHLEPGLEPPERFTKVDYDYARMEWDHGSRSLTVETDGKQHIRVYWQDNAAGSGGGQYNPENFGEVAKRIRWVYGLD